MRLKFCNWLAKWELKHKKCGAICGGKLYFGNEGMFANYVSHPYFQRTQQQSWIPCKTRGIYGGWFDWCKGGEGWNGLLYPSIHFPIIPFLHFFFIPLDIEDVDNLSIDSYELSLD